MYVYICVMKYLINTLTVEVILALKVNALPEKGPVLMNDYEYLEWSVKGEQT